ncbi:TrmB family transcriptional regulator [Candidatus Bathyarchaeota archaeon]|nr:TrmB family transcriptional regulator [Candidatus Bathyarchaeota archaeon]
MEAGLLQSMRVLGFTPYEARAYHTLVRYGEMTARELSSLSGIPYSKTYEVLSRLQEKGFVEVQKARPMRFKAVAPRDALKRYGEHLLRGLEEEHRQQLRSLEERFKARVEAVNQALRILGGRLQTLYEGRGALEASEEVIWTIKGRENILCQIKSLIREASHIEMILPSSLLNDLYEALRGARGEVIVDVEDERLRGLRGIALYRMEETPFKCLILIADGRNTIFTSESLETAFKSSNPGLVTILKHFFRHEREEAKPL